MDLAELLKGTDVDYEDGLKRFSGNAALYEKFLCRFISDENMSLVKDAYNRNDMETLTKAAHTLKGIAGNLSIVPLYKSTTLVVNAIKLNQLNNLDRLMQTLYVDYNRAVDLLKKIEP